MLLAIDVGNTNIVVGVFDGPRLVEHWRMTTATDRTADEFIVLLKELFLFSQMPAAAITGIMIASVVPPLAAVVQEALERYLGLKPLVLGPGVRTGMPILYDNPKEVGADRVANSVAAYDKYPQALIIVDFGTATTFDYVSAKGEYRGGVIAPGITISADALFQRAAKLPRVEIQKPKTVIGKDTVASMQSGLLYGYVGLVDGIVQRMTAEIGTSPRVIATGGLAPLIAAESHSITAVEPFLTLEGLRIIYDRNR